MAKEVMVSVEIANPNEPQEVEECTCDIETEEHTCPYLEDIGGDSETLCTCCSKCQHQCAMEI